LLYGYQPVGLFFPFRPEKSEQSSPSSQDAKPSAFPVDEADDLFEEELQTLLGDSSAPEAESLPLAASNNDTAQVAVHDDDDILLNEMEEFFS
jgi:hypothetical protein